MEPAVPPLCVVCAPIEDWLRYCRQVTKGRLGGSLTFTKCCDHDEALVRKKIKEISRRAGVTTKAESARFYCPKADMPYYSKALASAAPNSINPGGTTSLIDELARKVATDLTDFPGSNELPQEEEQYPGIIQTFGVHPSTLFRLSVVTAQMSNAVTAFRNAHNALATLNPRDFPIRGFAESMRILTRFMQAISALAEKKRQPRSRVQPESEHCIYSRELVWKHDVPGLAQQVALEGQAEQDALIRAYLHRWRDEQYTSTLEKSSRMA